MKLVREREVACARGDQASCDLYFFGFHNENELAYDGIPTKFNTPRTRYNYQHPGTVEYESVCFNTLMISFVSNSSFV